MTYLRRKGVTKQYSAEIEEPRKISMSTTSMRQLWRIRILTTSPISSQIMYTAFHSDSSGDYIADLNDR